ncbi:MAG: ATP-binding protein, partial [Actinobacteria bacterium]|nr:ATP-binding protein [Actinomycetota bacterium]
MLARSQLRVGAVRGRYFRENFAQGGIDLVQIIPELVTNADAAIAATGRERGRIELSFSQPDPAFLKEWRAQTRTLGVPALGEWRWEVRCRDDGVGVNAEAVDRRLGALGELPEHDGAQRGLFGRGLRDVWLAQGAGRIEGARDGYQVQSWFFPAAGDDPYAYVHVRDAQACGVAPYTLVSVPLASGRLPADGRLRTLVCQLVQLRPVLEDRDRELVLTLPSGTVQIARFPAPQPDRERPVLFDDVVDVSGAITARVTVRRSTQPLSAGMSRATRLGGLVVRSGRAAHESTLGSHEGRPGTRHLYGEVRCDALESLQRAALDSRRPQVVVKVDRSGLNDTHPVVRALYAAIDRVLAPIVADEERRQSARTIRPTNALRARDQVGLRALNDALKTAFDTPGKAAFQAGAQPAEQAPAITDEPSVDDAPSGRDSGELVEQRPAAMVAALRFKQALV